MKLQKTAYTLAILLTLLTCTACGAKSDESYTNGFAPAEVGGAAADPAPHGEAEGAVDAEGDAGDVVMKGEDYADEALEAAGEAEDSADGLEAAPGEAMGDAPVPEGPDVVDPYVVEPDVEDPDSKLQNGVQAQASLLTAGQWNDHENWGFFSNLVNTGVIAFPSFGLDPTCRVAVTAKAADGAVLPNATAELLDAAGNVLWTSVTDKDGHAYLIDSTRSGVQVRLSSGGSQQTADIEAAASGGSQGGGSTDRQTEITLESTPVLFDKTQVMFILDTTGSMGDEMLYLQSDFSAIAEEVGDADTTWAVSFYKDAGDSYVTRTGDFTNDVSAIRSQLSAESADGGGDEPEAVAEVLKETMFHAGWQDDAAKVAFLIFDAPPHTGQEETLQAAIAEASRRGIHLVPVVSSNGSRDTELFGRAAAICTNGSYVFLTDDSGIGDSHLEPIIGDYEVEKLHDIIVRIIREYRDGQ